MKMKKGLCLGILFLFVVTAPLAALAKVSPEEAEKLKSTLTPFGAERAGNADGTIPAWEGGITGPPGGGEHKPGDRHINPYADEEKLFSITEENMDEYADKLGEGQKKLLRAHPDTYRLDVYPSHRSHAAPQWVYENTFKNATRAETSDGGVSISNAYGGIPFPIPKNGAQVVWNHLVRWQGEAKHYLFNSLYVDGDNIVIASGVENNEKFPYYNKEKTLESYESQDYWYVLLEYFAPPRKKGETLLVRDPLNRAENPRQSWQYLVGQRRVRRAPTIAYDTPLSSMSGIHTWDDVYLFNGGLDRYNWKILGKKEIYIPYNCYDAQKVMDKKEMFPPEHVNPDHIRWELHRVWKVEGNLKEGSRHIYAKRVFYVDEDSWVLTMADSYDAQGSLWRSNIAPLINEYQLPGMVQMFAFYYDFRIDKYGVNASQVGLSPWRTYPEPKPDSFFTPEELRRRGRR